MTALHQQPDSVKRVFIKWYNQLPMPVRIRVGIRVRIGHLQLLETPLETL